MTAPRTTDDLVALLDAEADQAPTAHDFLQRHPIERRRPVRRWVSIAAAIVVVVALAVALARRSDHARPPASAVTPTASHTYLGLTLRFPKAWHAVPVQFNSGGAEIPLGYITSQVPGAECRVRGSQGFGCGPPIAALGPGDLLILINGGPSFGRAPQPTTTIAGLPARSETTAPPGGCGVQADHQQVVTLYLPEAVNSTPRRVIMITICTRGPTAARTDAAIKNLFATATYRPPSVVGRVSGLVRLVGGPVGAGSYPGSGDVLVYATARRSGPPLARAHLDAGGAFTFTIRPGRYWLSTTAAVYNTTPCADRFDVVVRAGATVSHNIRCDIKKPARGITWAVSGLLLTTAAGAAGRGFGCPRLRCWG